jgi:hypothetical protein
MPPIDLPQLIALLVGVVLPLLSGLVTRVTAEGHTRAVVLLALAGLTNFLSEYLAALESGGVFIVTDVLLGTLATFLVGVGAHFGLLKGTRVSDWAKSTGGFIGRRDDYDLAA